MVCGSKMVAVASLGLWALTTAGRSAAAAAAAASTSARAYVGANTSISETRPSPTATDHASTSPHHCLQCRVIDFPPGVADEIGVSNSSALSTTVTLAPRTLRSNTPRWRGVNVVNQSPSGYGQSGLQAMKTPADWENAFANVANMLNNDPNRSTNATEFNAVRLYSTMDGSGDSKVFHLMNAMPAARTLNLSIHAGVWSGGDNNRHRFRDEIDALDAVLEKHGCGNLAAVSVGNEDIYNNRTDTGNARAPLADVWLLVEQVQQAMAILDRHGCCHVPVTHTDTFSEWLKSDVTEVLIRQVDFLTVNIFPYWEKKSVSEANQSFWDELKTVQGMAAKYNKSVWVGETGWPTAGPTRENAIAGTSEAEQYWKAVGCRLFNEERNLNAFYYVEWDAPGASPSFGLLSDGGLPVFSDGLSCP